MTVLYSCALCGLGDVAVEVPDREDDESIGHWVGQTVGFAISRDHDERSPSCHPKRMTKVMIPMPVGNEPIGKPTKH